MLAVLITGRLKAGQNDKSESDCYDLLIKRLVIFPGTMLFDDELEGFPFVICEYYKSYHSEYSGESLGRQRRRNRDMAVYESIFSPAFFLFLILLPQYSLWSAISFYGDVTWVDTSGGGVFRGGDGWVWVLVWETHGLVSVGAGQLALALASYPTLSRKRLAEPSLYITQYQTVMIAHMLSFSSRVVRLSSRYYFDLRLIRPLAAELDHPCEKNIFLENIFSDLPTLTQILRSSVNLAANIALLMRYSNSGVDCWICIFNVPICVRMSQQFYVPVVRLDWYVLLVVRCFPSAGYIGRMFWGLMEGLRRATLDLAGLRSLLRSLPWDAGDSIRLRAAIRDSTLIRQNASS
ncbi:hypothetical protein Tco_1392510 [Tanacetum coccineum]